MTREEAKEWQEGICEEWDKQCFDDFIDKIFNEHEAQLKDKDEEINLAKYRHQLEHERYIIDEKIIEEKDEEIVDLQKYNKLLYSLMTTGEKRGVDKGISKARSIIAMLFWEYKKSYRMLKKYTNTKKEHDIKIIMYERDTKFKQAYKMLKDNND